MTEGPRRHSHRDIIGRPSHADAVEELAGCKYWEQVVGVLRSLGDLRMTRHGATIQAIPSPESFPSAIKFKIQNSKFLRALTDSWLLTTGS